jgi:hypothetical protein
MLIKICTKPSLRKSHLFWHSTQYTAVGEMLNISCIKILLLRNCRLLQTNHLYMFMRVTDLLWYLRGLSLFVSKQFILTFGPKHFVFVLPSGMLKLPNVRHCCWPIMTTLMQYPSKFWFAVDHTKHLILVPTCYGQCSRRRNVTAL